MQWINFVDGGSGQAFTKSVPEGYGLNIDTMVKVTEVIQRYNVVAAVNQFPLSMFERTKPDRWEFWFPEVGMSPLRVPESALPDPEPPAPPPAPEEPTPPEPPSDPAPPEPEPPVEPTP